MKVYSDKELQEIKDKRKKYSSDYYYRNEEKVKKSSKVRYDNLKKQLKEFNKKNKQLKGGQKVRRWEKSHLLSFLL